MTDTTEKTRREVVMLRPDQIHTNPDNPRLEAGDVTELAQSIKEAGEVLQPILVVPSPTRPGMFMLEDGYRRWVACRVIGFELPSLIRGFDPEDNFTAHELVVGLVTDLKKQLTPMERAKAYGRLVREANMTQAEIARRTGVTQTTVSRYLSLLELSLKSQEAVRTGKLSVDNAVHAIKRSRATNREKEGKKPVDVGWMPDHFSSNHHLAKAARTLCDGSDHSNRRRLGGACGVCWEVVIRQDQDRVRRVLYRDNDDAPELIPISPDGAIRANGVRGAE